MKGPNKLLNTKNENKNCSKSKFFIIHLGSIPSRLGVPYGESEHEKLDIFGSDLPDDSPIYVFFSGGYWQLLSGVMSAYVVEPMYNAGIVAVIVDYARAPGGKIIDFSSFYALYQCQSEVSPAER